MRAGEVQRNRPLQQLVCHLKSFPPELFDVEMKKSLRRRLLGN